MSSSAYLPIPDGVCCSRANTLLETGAWVIEKFSLCRTRGSKVKSGTFVSVKDDRLKWFLELNPSDLHGDDFDNDVNEYVSLLLKTVPIAGTTTQEEEQKPMKIKASIVSSKKKLCKTTEADISFRFSSETYFKADLFNVRENSRTMESYLDYNPKDARGDLLPNDTLTIAFEMDLLLGYENQIVTSGNQEGFECSLVSDLTSLLEGGAYSDITIKAGKKTFKAHKAILTTRSCVFRAMFENDMTEAARNCVEIKDMNPQAVQEMLRYIYTGTAPKVDKMADALLQAADKYDLKQLKAMCERELTSQLSEENVADTCELALRHSAIELKAKCIGFMAINTPHLVSKYIRRMERDGEEDSISTSKKRKMQ